MPLMIEELSTSLEVQDDVKLRAMVREEIQKYMRHARAEGASSTAVDPADPAAAGGPYEGSR
jgi:hypothetical protein